MKKGFLATLFAAAVSFAGTTAAFAAAPVISGIPDLQIGDMEDNPSGTDNNFFIFTNAFQFSTKVADADTADGDLLWSFAEYYDVGAPYSDTQQQFQINGKDPIAVGATAVAAEASGGHVNAKAPGANRLNASSDWATFRDIIFSPLNQTEPFTPAASPAQMAYSATAGKNVVFYVADLQGNLDETVIKVKTKDGDFDKVSVTFTPELDHGGPPSNAPFAGWVESGLNSNTGSDVLGNVDDVDRTASGAPAAGYEIGEGVPTTTQNEIGTIVRAGNQRYRILGWINPNGVAYPGADKYVRGKFYVYTNNAAGAATNAYPNFRARVQHGGAYVGVTNYQYGQTGNTGGTGGDFPYSFNDSPAGETGAGTFLKPSRTPSKPSLYRVDLDPIDVPAAASRNILPVFESFAFNDPANATIMLTQLTMGTFPALADGAGNLIMNYSATTGSAGFDFAGGALNAEGDLTFGYKQNIFLTAGQLAFTSNTSGAGSTGLLVDTHVNGTTVNPAYTNRFVIGVIDLQPTANTARPRIQPGKYYRARFYATSDIPTTAAATGTYRQGNLRFRLQTASNVINAYQEFVGALNTSQNTAAGAPGSAQNNTYRDTVIGGQAMPGTNSVNPDKDNSLEPSGAAFNGGWYTVLLPTPLDGDIRRDVDPAGVVSATTFGTLFSQPGPGNASASLLDIKTGLDVYTNPLNLKLGATTNNGFYDANRARVSLTAVRIYEYDASTVTDDGGYVY